MVALDGEDIVGHFGTMSVCASVGGALQRGRISMGFMVDGICRGRGVASGLSDALFEALSAAGQDRFVIGFPNDVSFHMHTARMEYTPIRDYRFVTLPRGRAAQRYEPISGDAFTGFLPGGVSGGFVDSVGANHLCHDAAYLSWRYGADAYQKYRSASGGLFVATRYADKADILYWRGGGAKSGAKGSAAQ
ncbi:MAG: GNAT family N-acetyltransferase, partial [Clostridiales Family XIII bacterium]|nr:GNAT family N-acetyltransferase [Clostridiales Family XIII bacterium]